MAGLLVTVGMGPWPFDRLIAAVSPLCAYHDVFVQAGTSTVVPPCPHAPYVPLDEMQRRLAEADVVITHAGGTVRLAQRLGKVPIAVARTVAHGEAADDRQVGYLRAEERTGRVHSVWDLATLPGAVAGHASLSRRLITRPLPPAVPDHDLVAVLSALCDRLIR
jgi:UDP-N-acetylglucosamine transferase subunit ALG13